MSQNLISTRHCSSQGHKKTLKKIKALKVRHIYVFQNLCVCRPKMPVKTGSNAHEAKSGKLLIHIHKPYNMYVHIHVYVFTYS